MKMLINIISAFLSTIGFSVVFQVQRKHVLASGMLGAVSWGVYLFLTDDLAFSTVWASFIATLLVTALSYVLAKLRKTPIIVFLVGGIIPLVPGVGLYRTMYNLLQQDYATAINYMLLTFEIAGVIAGAIVIISLLPLLWRKTK